MSLNLTSTKPIEMNIIWDDQHSRMYITKMDPRIEVFNYWSIFKYTHTWFGFLSIDILSRKPNISAKLNSSYNISIRKKNYIMLILVDYYSQPNENRSVHEQKKVNIEAFIFNNFLEQKQHNLFFTLLTLHFPWIVINRKFIENEIFIFNIECLYNDRLGPE